MNTTEKLIEIFDDSIEFSRESGFKSETTLHTIGEHTSKYTHYKPVGYSDKRDYDTNVEVVNSDTVSAAQKYSKYGKTALLNMASYKRPGGGVRRGSRAQEECLFRCSNLGDVISTDFYPLKTDQALYTKDAYFFKDFHYGYIRPFKSDVITIAAINLNGLKKPDNYVEIMTDKIRLMIGMAMKNDVDNLILGAWGCGVFDNDPRVVSTIFKVVITEFKGCFKNIIFAIINDHNSVGNNYQIFKETFSEV